MGVTKELSGNDMRRIPLDNLIIIVGIIVEASIVARRNMANDPNTLSLIFSKLQMLNHPRKNTIRIL